VTTGGNDVMDDGKSKNPFKMGRKLRKHIKESGNAGQKTGFEDDSDEE
jgi:hypothetical protein